MKVNSVVAQLRTTDLDGSIRFYTTQLGFALAFRFEDFYAGIRAGSQLFHLKHVDRADPTIGHIEEGGHFHLYFEIDDATTLAAALRARGVPVVGDVCDTAWGTREFIVRDDQGHVLYFAQPLSG